MSKRMAVAASLFISGCISMPDMSGLTFEQRLQVIDRMPRLEYRPVPFYPIQQAPAVNTQCYRIGNAVSCR